MRELLGLLQKQSDWSFVVAGHTDNVGTDAMNVPLSQQCAEAVIACLSAKACSVDVSSLGLAPRCHWPTTGKKMVGKEPLR